jgi:hypothetical protein
MHNNTHSVHNCLLKSRRDLPCLWSCCYVSPPPLSGTNCCPSPFPGGAGPPAPKMASLFPGSAHTSSLPSVTKVNHIHIDHINETQRLRNMNISRKNQFSNMLVSSFYVLNMAQSKIEPYYVFCL